MLALHHGSAEDPHACGNSVLPRPFLVANRVSSMLSRRLGHVRAPLNVRHLQPCDNCEMLSFPMLQGVPALPARSASPCVEARAPMKTSTIAGSCDYSIYLPCSAGCDAGEVYSSA